MPGPDDVVEYVQNLVLARARDVPQLADKIIMSEADEDDPKPLPLPYIMIFMDNAQRTSDLIASAGEKVYFNYTVHYVGETWAQINQLVRYFYAQWNQWRPVVPGYRSFKMMPNFSTPDNTNDALHPPLLYRVDEWGLLLIKGRGVVD